MCMGYAICINDRTVVGGEGSHTGLCIKHNLKEDACLKVNIIYADNELCKYKIAVDNHGSAQIKHYKDEGFIDENIKIIPSYVERIHNYCNDNLSGVFKYLCAHAQQSYLFYQDNAESCIRDFQNNRVARIKEQNNYGAKIATNQNNKTSVIRDSQINDWCVVGVDQKNSNIKITGMQVNHQSSMKDQLNGSASIAGDQINSFAKILGDIVLYNTKVGDERTTALLMLFSREQAISSKATLTNFIKWLEKRYDKNKV